jgi:hypothetical protein
MKKALGELLVLLYKKHIIILIAQLGQSKEGKSANGNYPGATL